nr:PREDICTED: cation channel sperm-associated protein 1 [Lepisosteus oculatus]
MDLPVAPGERRGGTAVQERPSGQTLHPRQRQPNLASLRDTERHHLPVLPVASPGGRRQARERIFSTCEVPEAVIQQLIRSSERDRRQRALQARRSCLGRAWGALLDRCRLLYQIVFAFTESRPLDNFLLAVVVLNTGALVAQTFDSVAVRGGWFFSAMDASFLSIYLMEFALKVFVWGRVYFRNAWNILDFVIVFMSLVDFVLPLIQSTSSFSSGNASTVFRILRIFKGIRAIRAFRVLRTIRFLQNLQAIMSTCLQSLQSMGAIIVLMFTFLFMFAVIFREMFSVSDPDRFGSMFKTIFTLFQLLTLDDWAYIYSTSRDQGYPYIIIFLVLYIVVEYFTFLNLFIAVLVDNFQLAIKRRMERKKDKSCTLDDSEDDTAALKKKGQPSGEQDNETFLQRAIQQNYSQNKFSKREVQLMTSYFRLLAAIDLQHHAFRSQGATLDRVVDTFFEAAEEEEEECHRQEKD